jgi:hypothetical protein
MPRRGPTTSVYGGNSSDGWYRYNGRVQRDGISAMPENFQKVDNGWNLNADAEQERLTSHERTPTQDWDYALTYKFNVATVDGGPPKILKGHVHYKDTGGGTYEAVPGNFWVEKIKNCEGRTPGTVVNKFSELTSLNDWETLREFQATGLEAIAANANEIFKAPIAVRLCEGDCAALIGINLPVIAERPILLGVFIVTTSFPGPLPVFQAGTRSGDWRNRTNQTRDL